jgi:predicted MFS family arabinose efflux permease
MVAVVQLAITTGAAGGGVLFDSSGYRATFLFSAVILCLSASVILVGALRRKAKSSLGCEAYVNVASSSM